MTRSKKILALVMALLMLTQVIMPMSAFADDITEFYIEEGASSVMYVGDSYSYVCITDAPSDEAVVWTSSDESIATIDQDGDADFLKAGTVTLTASLTDFSDEITIEVKEMPVITVGGEDVSVDLVEGNNYLAKIKFVPTATGVYQFNVSGLNYLQVYIYDEQSNLIAEKWMDEDRLFASLTKDETYYIFVDMNYADYTDSTTVSVITAPTVESLYIDEEPYHTTFLKEEIDEITGRGFSGLSIGVKLSDGTTEYWDGNLDENTVAGNDVERYVSETGKLVFTCAGKKIEYQYNVIDNPVSKIEYVGEPLEYIKGTNCSKFVDSDGEYFYYYSFTPLYAEDAFKVTYKDGSIKYMSLYGEVVDDIYLDYDNNQYYDHWYVGEDNYINVWVGNVKIKLNFKIVETKVAKVEVTANPTVQPVFGDLTAGDMDDYWYYYYLKDLDGLRFTVTYKDGTKKDFKGEDVDIYNNNIGDYWFETDQFLSVEKSGKTKVFFNFEGYESSFTVDFKDAGISKIEVVKGPDIKEIPEGFIPSYIGTKFKVTYKDGKTETLEITKDNLSIYSGMPYAEQDGKAFTIQESYDEDNDRYITYLYFNGTKCELGDHEVTFKDALEVDSISVKNSGDTDKMVITVKYADGNTEDFNTNVKYYEQIGGFGGDPDWAYDYFYINTKYGLTHVSIETYSDAGLPSERYIYAFYQSFYEELNVNVELSKIEVSKKPDIVRYEKGEEFDPTGLEIKTIYSNGVEGVIYYGYGYDIELSEVNTDTVGTKTVKVKFNGKETSFTIEVGGSFKDVKSGSWYEKYVNYAAKYGIFNGTGNGNFSPDTNLTRAQFVQVLANIEGVDTDNSIKTDFKDVASGKWYTGAVQWAAENNIVSGMGDGTFKPNADVTREQMCVILANFIEKYRKGNFDKKVIGITFADDADISSWAKAAVYKAQRAGLVSGVGNNKFAPKLTATRKEGATIFTKFHGDYVY